MKNKYQIMGKPKKTISPEEIPAPDKHAPDIIPQADPEEPVLPAEPDFIPEEDPYDTPPYEVPTPSERP